MCADPIDASDVSWGTKGDNKVSVDLGVVKTGPNKNEVEVMVPTAETDINAAYEDAIHMLSTKPPKQDPKPDPQTEQEDYYRTFRTKYVARSTYTAFGWHEVADAVLSSLAISVSLGALCCRRLDYLDADALLCYPGPPLVDAIQRT